MTVTSVSRRLDETLARAAESLDFARGIRVDLEVSGAGEVPEWLWRR